MVNLIIAIILTLSVVTAIGVTVFVWIDYWLNGIFGFLDSCIWSMFFLGYGFILGVGALCFWSEYLSC